MNAVPSPVASDLKTRTSSIIKCFTQVGACSSDFNGSAQTHQVLFSFLVNMVLDKESFIPSSPTSPWGVDMSETR